MTPKGMIERQSTPEPWRVPGVLEEANKERNAAIDTLNQAILAEAEKADAIIGAAKRRLHAKLSAAKAAFDALNIPAAEALRAEETNARKALAAAQTAFDARMEAADSAYKEITGQASSDLQNTLLAVHKEFKGIEKAARSAVQQETARQSKAFRQTEHQIKTRLKRAKISLVPNHD